MRHWSWCSHWCNLHFLLGYQEIRRDKYNYPVYKKQDGNTYIIHDPPEDEDDNNHCHWWTFFGLDDEDHPQGPEYPEDSEDKDIFLFKKGRLMGNHEWDGWSERGSLRQKMMIFNVTITRI